MTESDWLTATEPMPLLEFLRHGGLLIERKAQLFAAACCRAIWHLLTDPRSRWAVEVAEQHAEGRIANEQLMAAWAPAWEAVHEATEAARAAETSSTVAPWNLALAAEAAGNALAGQPFGAATSALDAAQGAAAEGRDAERQRQAALVRDLFGPLPFRPVHLEASWRTAAVMALANSIDAEARFEDMPILADALEEAGCDHPEILGHCRQRDDGHARGCWVLDLLLGMN